MAQFELNESNHVVRTPRAQPQSTGIIGFLMSRGIAKNELMANVIMLVIVVCLVSISFVLLAPSSEDSAEPAFEDDLLLDM